MALADNKHKAAERLLQDIYKSVDDGLQHCSFILLTPIAHLFLPRSARLQRPVPPTYTAEPEGSVFASGRRASWGSLHLPLTESEAESEAHQNYLAAVAAASAEASSTRHDSAQTTVEGDRTPTPGSPEARRRAATVDQLPDDVGLTFPETHRPPCSPGLPLPVSNLRSGHRRTKSDVMPSPRSLHGIAPSRRAVLTQQLISTAGPRLSAGDTAAQAGATAASPVAPESPVPPGTTPGSSGSLKALADRRPFGSLKSSPTSSTSSLLDTGHAFEWPVARATSANALTDMQHQAMLESSGLNPLAASNTLDLTLETCMAAENNFINALMEIGERLRRFTAKDVRRTQLFGELALLNLNLPARVYMPLGAPDENGKMLF